MSTASATRTGSANSPTPPAHRGIVAVEHALGHEPSAIGPIPWAQYTFPEVAGVGLTEAKAREKETAHRHRPVSPGASRQGDGAAEHTEGFVKTIRHRETDALLGVHIVGHNATEMIHAAATMIGQGATTRELAETVFAHPTLSEAIKESAEDALGQGPAPAAAEGGQTRRGRLALAGETSPLPIGMM